MKKLITIALLSINAFAFSQNVQIHYSGNNKKIADAVTEANKILSNTEFYKKIDLIPSFSNSSYTGSQVSREMQTLNRVIEVKEYWNPASYANAKTIAVIKINTAKLHRNIASITNTLIHETVHATDWWTNNKWDYTHDGNNSGGQEKTAPYVIGAIGESFVK